MAEGTSRGGIVWCYFVFKIEDGRMDGKGKTDGLAFLLAEPAGHQFAVFGHGR